MWSPPIQGGPLGGILPPKGGVSRDTPWRGASPLATHFTHPSGVSEVNPPVWGEERCTVPLACPLFEGACNIKTLQVLMGERCTVPSTISLPLYGRLMVESPRRGEAPGTNVPGFPGGCDPPGIVKVLRPSQNR